MNLNLAYNETKEVQYFINKFIEQGWKREDEFVIILNTNDNITTKIFMTLYYELLSYDNIVEPWVYCKFAVFWNHPLHDELIKIDLIKIKYLKKFYEYLSTKISSPFYDEDAFCRYLKKLEDDVNYSEYKFYINEAYPKGQWENHTL